MSSETKQSKQSRQAAALATGELEAARERYLSDPRYARSNELLDELQDDPYTYGDDDLQRMQDESSARAYSSAKGALGESAARSTVRGGYRSGTTYRQQQGVAAGLGEGLASGYRQSMLQAAQQRMADLLNVINAGNTQVGNEYALSSGVANARLGQANVLSGLAQTQSQTAGPGAIIGQLLGGFGGAAGKAAGGGVFK